MNLLSNARTHTPPGTRVRLSITELDDTVELLVHDDGPGFPAGLADRAHERFVRGAHPPRQRLRRRGFRRLRPGPGDRAQRGHRATGAASDIDSDPGDTTVRIRLPRG